ncbi:biotin synthase [Sphingomonas sp. YR710]|uniref:biotin synthase BioB n=1 Tax=Sphingomonas sp. YR710 TaxID=1882773 RepID=UPI0008919BD3|nr:biotin synthase BioB [Sphingomonas sp. YR710]SDC23944.1 biotin synthase [Sphingomonas sp. YR710]
MNEVTKISPLPAKGGAGGGFLPSSIEAHGAPTHPQPLPAGREGSPVRNDWTREEIAALFDLPFNDLLWQAQTVHRRHHDANAVQLSTLLSIKTGGCAENCGYCSQAAGNDTDLKASKLMQVEEVLTAAREAKASGSERFCMGAAWRSPKDRDMDAIVAMVEGVKAMGLETCMTLGMLSDEQTERLADAGLDYYNHNLDSSPEYYGHVVTTRSYDDRLQTLERVRNAGINVCCGGIMGMGEARSDRVGFIHALATLPEHPGSVPINELVPIDGTPLGDMLKGVPSARIDDIEFVRTVAVARITMPDSVVRLSAGRESMSDATQALCFMAGANSIFTGDRLLTTGNAGGDSDAKLFAKLGLKPSLAK